MASVAAPGPTATGFLAALDQAERSDLLRRGRRRRYRRGATVFHEGGGSDERRLAHKTIAEKSTAYQISMATSRRVNIDTYRSVATV